MRVLAIKLRRLGDTVLWTSALEALCEHIPHGEIDILYPRSFEELFQSDQRFAKQFPIDPEKLPDRKECEALRARQYDAVLVFHASGRALKWALASGAKKRLVHHHSRQKKNFSSDAPIVDLGRPMSAIERDLNVVRTLGWSGSSPATSLKLSSEELDHSSAFDVVIGPLASRPAKMWPIEYYWRLCEALSSRLRVAMVLPDKNLLPQDQLQRFSQVEILETQSLRQLMQVLASSKCFVGADSGVKHVAVALGTPTLTFFGPESVGEWHGYDGVRNPVLRTDVLCRDNDSADPQFSWCGAYACPLSSHACLRTIDPDSARAAVDKLLSSV